MSIWRFAEHLPDIPPRHRITLGEGNTPLVRSRRIGADLGLDQLYFKLENCNPTGSFKDRFAVMAASDMAARGATLCLATSSGNTGSALAAACAVAGIPCYIAVVDGAPLNKVRNMQVYGAQTYSVRGFGRDAAITDEVMEHLNWLCDQRGAALQISSYVYSPIGMAGCETLAYELAEQMEGRLDHVFTQAGAGGMTLAIAKGFNRLVTSEALKRSPAVHCVQPEGNNTIAGPLREGRLRAQEVSCTTNISGLQVPNVIGGHEVIPACRATGGTGHLVSDEQVFMAQRRLAREEGIFAEPAGATALAGIIAAVRAGELRGSIRVACTVTGIGFKDEKAFLTMVGEAPCPCLDMPGAIDAYVASPP
jgi:threonine synthase